MGPAMRSLLTSRRFWLAVFGIAQTIFFHYYTDFPKDVWLAIDGLLGVMIAALTVDDTVAQKEGVHYLTGELTQVGLAKYGYCLDPRDVPDCEDER